MNNKNYINIQSWMIQELKLSGNELILYAIIFGFSQDGKSEYYGSLSYISESMLITRRSAINLIQKLLEKKLIKRTSESHYKVTGEKVSPVEKKEVVKKFHLVKKVPKVVKKVHLGGEKSIPLGGEKSIPNNNNTNNKLIIINNKQTLSISKNFKIPKVLEIKNYCLERKNDIDYGIFFDFYQSKGWMIGKNKMKDWKACVRTWERKNGSKNYQKKITVY